MKRYVLHDGRAVDLSGLGEAESLYLDWLRARLRAGETYEAIAPAVFGPGAFPLLAPTEVEEVARDLLARASDAPARRRDRDEGLRAGILTVTLAAERLGISRAAVIKAIR